MRFTDAQAALFCLGISFGHMSPDESRRKKAMDDFVLALNERGTYYDRLWRSQVVNRGVYAHFGVCTMAGEAWEHCPILFLEDPEEMDQRALAEARFILAPFGSLGPMVVR